MRPPPPAPAARPRRGSPASRAMLASSVTGSRGGRTWSDRLAEELHQHLQLALVGAVVAAPAAGQPELREEVVRAARRARVPTVDVAAPDRLPELGVAGAPERAAADEAVAADLEQELEPRRRHERPEHASPVDDPASSSPKNCSKSGVESLIATTLSISTSRSARSASMSTLVSRAASCRSSPARRRASERSRKYATVSSGYVFE